ncbi:amino acid ABC transporter ATP-binding protein [Pseudaminobacter sp. 19-2017]|uniref:Amino acid ABC transporter ATP-binding protein n=1 Tax=Pseudaminobacter soli (ex Zhang et al. 2022) TaxID=2831468 RepID=A0A942I3N9_9HYPH|nr:amino acid ABC transporter ATP-binding protein [Pseudaminobacter soli]MBS3650209.1 amino acid ABC transporter ATP-binding protein [Pseudaminobacter soli]
MSVNFIEVRSLRKTYGTTVAVDDVSLTLEEGRTAAIIGSSGCGKSTFLRCLNLLETPTEGSMRIGGDTVTFANDKMASGEDQALRFRKSMAMVFQSFDLFPHMTALRNVSLAPTIVNGLKREEAEGLALKLLERVDLRHKADAYPGQLSGGQAQRVAIARALAMNPRVLLFDEATSALDPELVGEVLAVIKDLAKEGRTLLVVTHELAFARDVADTLYFFDQGRVLESGKPQELMSNPQTERLRAFLKRFQGPLNS